MSVPGIGAPIGGAKTPHNVLGFATFEGPDSSTQNVTLPSGIQAGERLLAFVEVVGGTAVATPSGWSLLKNITSGTGNPNRRLYVFQKTATGSEGATQAFSTSNGASGHKGIQSVVYRMTASPYAVEISTGVIQAANVSTLDPDAITPSWGADEEAIFFAVLAGEQNPTTWPSGFPTGQLGGTPSIVVAVTYLKSPLATMDPGAFSWSTACDCVAITVAVRGPD